MVSTFTPNVNFEEPARGDQVGVWDTPENANWTLTDLLAGGVTTISLNNANVVLAAAQFQSAVIVFNSTLTGSVTITFPTSFKKPYSVQNLCTGSSAFTITLATTAGGNVICCPPGQIFDCFNNGSNLVYKNFGPHVGGYWDYAGSSVPNWVSGCSIPPYLNCDGTVFSSATYPALTVIMGGTTLPDARGRGRAALNQGTGRLTAAGGGVDGNTFGSGGGSEFTPAHTHAATVTDPGHAHLVAGYNAAFAPGNNSPQLNGNAPNTNTPGAQALSAVTGITVTNASAGAGASQNVPPTYVGGLALIRAA